MGTDSSNRQCSVNFEFDDIRWITGLSVLLAVGTSPDDRFIVIFTKTT